MTMTVTGAVLHIASPVGQGILVALLTREVGRRATRSAAARMHIPTPLRTWLLFWTEFLLGLWVAIRVAAAPAVAGAGAPGTAAAGGVVFADPSGRRRRRLRVAAVSFGLACSAQLLVVGLSFTGGPVGPDPTRGAQLGAYGQVPMLDETWPSLPGGEEPVVATAVQASTPTPPAGEAARPAATSASTARPREPDLAPSASPAESEPTRGLGRVPSLPTAARPDQPGPPADPGRPV